MLDKEEVWKYKVDPCQMALTKEKQMRGAFYFGITQGAISIDINPSTVQIQKSGETVMQQLPNKSPNFHRKLNSPNQSPNYLRN